MKHVTFNATLYVTYIPSRLEYSDIKNILWWSDVENRISTQSALNEIKLVLLSDSRLTLSDAKSILFQSNDLAK